MNLRTVEVHADRPSAESFQQQAVAALIFPSRSADEQHMDWKQPEGLRRHWLLEQLDGELLFLPLPAGAAQGRIGDDVYDLRDNGLLRKRRTLAADGAVLATLEERAAGGGGTLRVGDAEYTWKPTNLMGTRWALLDKAGHTLFSYIAKPGLVKGVQVELGTAPPETLGIPMLLCWYAMVL